MNQSLLELVKTAVPLFEGFSEADIQTVISICKMRAFAEGEILVHSGSPSTEMMLILSGALLVRTANGVPLAQLVCPETIGEMGLLTGARRSATIEGVEPGRVALMAKDDLMQILAAHKEMALLFYQNMVGILAVRLKNENFLIRMLREEISDLEHRLSIKETREEKQETNALEGDIVAAFYKQIGNPNLSDAQKARDQEAYEALRRQGYSDQQIRQTASWAAKNVRGVKGFVLVKHCIQEALKEEEK